VSAELIAALKNVNYILIILLQGLFMSRTYDRRALDKVFSGPKKSRDSLINSRYFASERRELQGDAIVVAGIRNHDGTAG
jgi:hypothetical protein